MFNYSAIELRNHFISGQYKATAIARYFLDRIARYDAQVGAFLSVFEEQIMERARYLDQKRTDGKPLGKLAGIPIGIKDNILVEGEMTTCASKFLTNYRSPYQSTVANLILQEDAMIIGKTNLDEFGMGSSTENSALQKTHNPWNLRCTPGGSSGGSAAAVAARLCPISLGTDTGGSVRQPASFCGIVGFKPTYGRVSRYGVVAYASSLDQVGPLTAYTDDASLIMGVIGQHCRKDSTSIAEGPQNFLDCSKNAMKGLKIGVPWDFLKTLAKEPKNAFEKALELITSLGAVLVDIDLKILESSLAVYYILANAEASTNLARFDGIRYGNRSKHAQTIDEVYDFSKEEGFGPEVKRRILLGTYVISSGYKDEYYSKAQKVRTLIINSYQNAFNQCDLIATPVTPFGAFELGAIKDPLQMYLEHIYTIGVNLAGLPAISLPNCFTHDNKPLGLQLIGPQKADKLVLNAASIIEKILPFQSAIPPLFNEEVL